MALTCIHYHMLLIFDNKIIKCSKVKYEFIFKCLFKTWLGIAFYDCFVAPFHVCFNYVCCCCCQVTSVMSDSVRPHRRQPTRLPRPWDSPGKNTGMGCHFLLQCMKVKSENEVAQSCWTHSNPMDCILPGSSVHGIFQARVPEWGAIAFSLTLYT